jgi:hypothetical protein
MEQGAEGEKKAHTLKKACHELVNKDCLLATNGFIQDMPEEELQQADYIDLSNIHEVDPTFNFATFFKKLRMGTLVYFCEITEAHHLEKRVVVQEDLVEIVVQEERQTNTGNTIIYHLVRKK